MEAQTVKNSAIKVVHIVIEQAIKEVDYVPGDTISLFLEDVINVITPNTDINSLWGPKWSLFLTMIVDNIHPAASRDVAVSAVTEVLRRMTGHSEVTPGTILAMNVGLSPDETDNIISVYTSEIEQYMEIATKACNNLDIPSPREVWILYNALGVSPCPADAALLYEMKPLPGEPISKNSIPSMLAMMAVKRAKETVAEKALKSELAAEHSKSVIARYQKEVGEIAETTTDIERTIKLTEQVSSRYTEEMWEATRATTSALLELIEAKREEALAIQELTIPEVGGRTRRPVQTSGSPYWRLLRR